MAIEILEHGSLDERSDKEAAIAIAQALNKFYPNHPWIVAFQGRGLVVKHQAISDAMLEATGQRGFSALLPRGIKTHKDLTRAAIEFGGMLLENFGLPRGPWDGRDPVVPARYRWKQQASFT